MEKKGDAATKPAKKTRRKDGDGVAAEDEEARKRRRRKRKKEKAAEADAAPEAGSGSASEEDAERRRRRKRKKEKAAKEKAAREKAAREADEGANEAASEEDDEEARRRRRRKRKREKEAAAKRAAEADEADDASPEGDASEEEEARRRRRRKRKREKEAAAKAAADSGEEEEASEEDEDAERRRRRKRRRKREAEARAKAEAEAEADEDDEDEGEVRRRRRREREEAEVEDEDEYEEEEEEEYEEEEEEEYEEDEDEEDEAPRLRDRPAVAPELEDSDDDEEPAPREQRPRSETRRRARGETSRRGRDEGTKRRGQTTRRTKAMTDRGPGTRRMKAADDRKTTRRGQTTKRGRALERPAKGGGNTVTMAVGGIVGLVLLCLAGMFALSGDDRDPTPIAKGSAEAPGSQDAPGSDADAGDGSGSDAAVRRPRGRMIEFEGKRMTEGERDAIVAERRKGREPIEEVLGRALFDTKTERFRFVAARTGFAEESVERAEFQRYCAQVERYFQGWWERKKDDLADYTNGEIDSLEKLPRLKVALVNRGSFDRYTKLCKARCPRAAKETGFHDEQTGIVWSVCDIRAPHPPFYDSFLFACYTRQYDKNKERTPGEYIIWKKGSEAFGFLGIDVQVAVNEHWLVALQRGEGYDSVETSREYLQALEAMFQYFATTFSEVMKTRGKMPLVPLYIFKDRAGYLRYGKRSQQSLIAFAAGHYEPKRKLMMTFRPGGAMAAQNDPIGTLLHEGAHVLMHYLTNFREPTNGDLFWLQEGIADYCAGYRRTADGFAVGQPNKGRLREWKMIKALSGTKLVKVMPLEKLIKFNLIHFAAMMQGPGNQRTKQMQMGVTYIQSWALVHFLNHYDGGKYRAKFQKFMKRVLNKGSTYADFEAVFGKLDIAAMEKELEGYMKSLS